MIKGSKDEGIALIGFGSSRPYNREAMMHCIDLFNKAGVEKTYHSFIGRESPTISEMLETVKKDGIKKLIIVPYLMATGEMSLKYIPGKLGIDGRYGEHTIGDIEVEYLRPIGESPIVANIYDDMIKHCPAGKGKKALLLISHGSKVGYRSNLASMTKERLGNLGYKDVYTASVEFEEPNVSDCAEKMVKDGVRHIIAVPMLIASGIHLTEDIPIALGLREGEMKGTARIWDRDIRIDITKPIGKHPLMKEIVEGIVGNS